MKRVRTTSSTLQQSIDASATTTPTKKYAALDEDFGASTAIKCSLPPHESLTFTDLNSYEAHYAAQHSYRCSECSVNLPSNHLLQLHLSEIHDPFIALKRDAGEKTYACFIEDCDKVCIDWKKRRSHLVDKHGYPRNYDFFVIRDGIDGRSSLLRRGVDDDGHRKSSRERNSSNAQANDDAVRGSLDASVASNTSADDAVESISADLASLKMVPSSISFGRHKGKTGFTKR